MRSVDICRILGLELETASIPGVYIGETHCQQVLDDIVDNLFSLAVCDDLPKIVEALEVEVLHDDGAVRAAVGG